MSILPGVTFSYNLRLGHAQEGRAYVFLANFSVKLIYKKKRLQGAVTPYEKE